MEKNYINNYFILLFSIIPLSILAGPTPSLMNIVLIDVSFIVYLITTKNFSFFNNSTVRMLIIFYVYLIFNSLISLEPSYGINRNFGFIRVIILFVSINYFFQKKNFFNKVFMSWFLILIMVTFDIFFEAYTGKNILGYGSGEPGSRVVSFFKNEEIIGGYLGGFFLIIVGFFLDKYGLYKKNLIFLIALVFLLAIFVTGERANSIRALLSILLIFLFLRDFDLKKKIIFIVIFLISISILITNSNYLKLRFVKQIKPALSITGNDYFDLYKSGYTVFKNHPIFGVGNKNYRFVTCDRPSKEERKNNLNIYCSTHPHQIYFEFLSEHGLFGTMIMMFLFYKIIFSRWKILVSNFKYLTLCSYIYLLMVFLPLIPSGAFFGDYLLTIFAINLSILYASNTKLNIFHNLNFEKGR